MDVAHGAPPVVEPVALRFKTGVIAAAFIAALIGLLVFAVVNIAADVDAGFRSAITLNRGIGPYSGKQVFLLTSWLVSWPVLHLALRNRDVDLRRWFGVFLADLMIAVVLLWPPIFEAIADMIHTNFWVGAGVLIVLVLTAPILVLDLWIASRRRARRLAPRP